MAAVLPVSYFPDTLFLSVLKQNKEVVIDLGEHFIKQTIRNRTLILSANGILKLIVPLQKWRNNTAVKDIKIAYSENWQKLHWRSLESAYRNSPYFEYYEDRLHKLIVESNFNYLKDLDEATLHFVLDQLGIEADINYSSSYIKDVDPENDFRNSFTGDQDMADHIYPYIQVFAGADQFYPQLSSLDLICNEGPNSIHLLR